MCECRLFSCAILVLKIILVTGFNIDQLNYAVFGPVDNNKSMFGFTVAVHKDRGNRGWILVGAPEGQSKFQNPSIVQRGGTVYKCRSDTDDVCQQIPFDKTNNAGFVDVAIDEKSYQWFGATLSSSGRKDGPVVACAPRYIWFTKDLNRRDPVGTCYVSDGSFNKFEEYSPCRTMHWGYHRQGSCQAGFSAAINREGDRLFVGAPGSYYWQGQMYSIDAQAHFNYTPGYFGNLGYGSKGSVHQLSLENRPAVFSTREGKAPDDDSYIGYSTVVGHFQQGKKYEGIAVGMPRGNKLRGKVLLFTWDLVNYKNITISQQIGAYFGYSLAAADVNGDKKLDLIVGAPMHTDANTEDKYDVGRVYVFYQKNNFEESFSSSHFIDGTRSKGRFGHALASLGDLNQDGYDDFAVGAPYDGPNGRGAVYIYYGSKEGIRQKYGQVIYAETITGARGYLTTFGFSLAGGLDLDDNEYPDMAVGAYLSDSAFFFRARPVVFVDSYVQFLTDYKKIDIRKKNCRLPNGQDGTCTSINFCIKYFGKGIPDQLALKVQYILDTKVKVPRMGFKSHGNHTFNSTVQLRKDGAENCHREEIYMKNEIRDKLTPLEAEVKFFMLEDYSYSQPRNPLSHLKPVLDLNNPPSRTDAILIQNDCGDDNICIPNLHVNITSNVKEYLLGSNTTLQFDVVVSNLGEDSFETTFEMWYPSEGIFYKKTDISIPGMSCTQSENKTVVCDIGNPLPSGKIAEFKVLFQPYYHGGFPNRSYVFDVFVNSSNPEPIGSLDDNKRHIEIPIWIDASLDIKGHSISSIQPLSHYNDTMYSGTINNVKTESEIGPQVTHVYYVENKGPSQIQHAEVYILWPLTSLKDDDALLYLLEQPHTKGNVTCDYVPYANYKHKQLDAQSLTTAIWDRLNIDISSFTGTKTEITESKATIEGKVTETGEGVSSGIGVVNVNDTNISKEVGSGDSSSVFEKRHNESSSTTNVQTWGSLNPNGEYEYTESKYFTVWENGRAVTRWENTTTIRDAHGNILRTLYHNDNTGSQSENNLNSLNYKINLGQGEVQHLTARWFTTYGPNGEPITRWENRTIVKDLNGNILRSYIWDENRQEYRLETGSQTNTVQEELRLEEQRRQERLQQETRRRIEEQNRVEQRRQEEERRRTEAARREEAKRKEDERLRLEQKQKEEERIRIEEKRREEERIRLEEKRREEERIRIEEKRREEERIRVEEEERRRAEETRRTEERLRYEERRREEERRRLEESRRQTTTRYPNSRYDEERRRVEERHRQEEERRRQQSRLELERRRQEQWRKQQEERRLEETRRLEEERKAEEERRRHHSGEANGYENWSSEEARRYYEERRRQESGGYDNKRIVTGYFDRDGKYHDASKNPNEFVFNKTFVVESSTTIPIDISGGQIHGIGNSNFDDLGSGFTVQTLDLGSGNTLDSRSSQESYSQRGRGSSNYNAQGSGSGQGGYRREWHSEGGYSTSGQIPPSYFQNSIEEDTVSSRSSRSRPKRQAIDPSDRTADIKALIKCNATNCIYIRCDIGVLDSNHEVIIALRSRLNVRALKSLVGVDQPIRLSSMMVASITELPYMEPILKEKQTLYKNEVFTDVPVKEADRVQEVAPLWIYIVSAVAGIVMLLLLIWLLSKCGFFKRNRPSPGPERQPLNRNGYHSGDEAL